jgi:cytochrome c peroxidase
MFRAGRVSRNAFHMSSFRFTALLMVTVATVAAVSGCGPSSTTTKAADSASASSPRAMQVVQGWRAQLDTLDLQVGRLDRSVRALDTAPEVEAARTAFIAARASFKRVEVGLEYYAPSTTKAMNGPALPEVEEEEGPEAVFPPTGFQVIEELLFGGDPLAERETLRHEVETLGQLVSKARTKMQVQEASDAHVFDASKLELARIVALGITGFDSPVAGFSLAEADAALQGIQRAMAPYRTEHDSWQRLQGALASARATLQRTADRHGFDHFAFIVNEANTIGVELQELRVHLRVAVPAERRAFRLTAATLFDTNAFDPWALAPMAAPRSRTALEAQVALGARLFHDGRLSADGRRACSSCHLPEKAFTDGLPVNRARTGARLSRNTPSVINSGLQVGQFADLRTTYLEDQVTDVVENVDEMHGSLDAVVRVLARDSSMVAAARVAFVDEDPGAPALTASHLRRALAAYQRSLTRLNSPVDRALRGDPSAINDEVRRGFNVFVGKGKCATCHFLPLTNGTVPPMYQKSEVEVLGVPTRAVIRNGTVDPDEGRYRLSRATPQRYAFRTPALRNVALTAPYMHNGAYPTLESVVDFYNRGGGHGVGVRLDNQTLPPDSLGLSSADTRALVTFMRALTDTTGTQQRIQ